MEKYTPLAPDILFLEIVNFYIFGEQRSCDGREAHSALFGNEPKKTGACSARARTRGQNPLVFDMVPAGYPLLG